MLDFWPRFERGSAHEAPVDSGDASSRVGLAQGPLASLTSLGLRAVGLNSCHAPWTKVAARALAECQSSIPSQFPRESSSRLRCESGSMLRMMTFIEALIVYLDQYVEKAGEGRFEIGEASGHVTKAYPCRMLALSHNRRSADCWALIATNRIALMVSHL